MRCSPFPPPLLFAPAFFLLGERLEVGDALLERVLLLLGGDVLLDVGDDPVDHVLLLHAAEDVGNLKLVVQATADLSEERNK